MKKKIQWEIGFFSKYFIKIKVEKSFCILTTTQFFMCGILFQQDKTYLERYTELLDYNKSLKHVRESRAAARKKGNADRHTPPTVRPFSLPYCLHFLSLFRA